MTLKEFKIMRWDGVILPEYYKPLSGLYIIPNKKLADMYQSNKKLQIIVKDTKSVYDGILIDAILLPSRVIGGDRPNYQLDTNEMVIVPEMFWEGYPPQLGKVEVVNLPDELEVFTNEQKILVLNWILVALLLIFIIWLIFR
jgi:hypothetical protein